MEFKKEIEQLRGIVKTSSLFATVSLNSLLDRLPELEARAEKINIQDYDFLFMVGWVYSGIMWISRGHTGGLPEEVLDAVYDPSILKRDEANNPHLKAVHDVIDARHNRWFTAGKHAITDLTQFVNRGLDAIKNNEDNHYCFAIGQWFLWNLFQEKPEWASIQTCTLIGSSMFRGAISTLET
jgi:hypothetical protein